MVIVFVFVIGDLFLFSFLSSPFFLLSAKLTTDRSVERLALGRRRRKMIRGREGGRRE